MTATAPARTLDELLGAAAARWPDRPALQAPSATFTYAELDAAVTTAAGGLARAGARPGDRVAFALGHDAGLYTAPFVCSRLGVAGLLLDTSLAPDRWAHQLAQVRPALCVADAGHAGRLRTAAGGVPTARAATALPLDGDARDADLPLVPAEPDRTVVLLATSGTTGVPTIVPLTSRGLLHVGRAYLELLDLGEDERSLVVMPLHYIGALSTQTMTMPLVGGCNIVPADRRPVAGLGRMAEDAVTLLDAVPAWLAVLARQPARPVPTWRTLVYGGAPMPPATAQALAARHPRVAMYDVWGLTEAHGPVTARRFDPARPVAAGDVGQPLAGLRVRAAGAGGPAPGSLGELEVAGPSVTAGSIGQDRRRDGWLPTGDLGTVDADGHVRVLDRAKDVVVRGGVTVSCREVEQVLRTAPGVVDAAVFAVPADVAGEAVAAAVVTDTGADPDVRTLRRLVAAHVSAVAVPRRITRLDDLPRNAAGKVDKPALVTMVDGDAPSAVADRGPVW